MTPTAAETVLEAAVVSPAIDVLVVDDEPLFLDYLDTMLSREPGLRVVEKINRGHDAVAVAQLFNPAVAVVDLNLHDIPGETVCRRLRALDDPPAVVMCTGESTEAALWRAFRVGASGFVTKSSDGFPTYLRQAAREVAAGGTYADPMWAQLHRRYLAGDTPFGLTEREIAVTELLALGRSNLDIAQALTISEQTVKSHISSVLAKLRVTSRAGVPHKAIAAGLIGPHVIRLQEPFPTAI